MRKFSLVLFLILSLASAAFAQDAPTGGTDADAEQPSPILGADVFDRAAAALSAGDYDQAAFEYTLLILLNPTFSQAYYGRALSDASQGNFERALPDIERALTTAPASPIYREGVYTLRAEIFRQQGDLAGAIADFGAIIDFNPSADAYAQRALLQLGQRDYQGAADDLTEAIALDDSIAVLYAYRAFAFGQIEGASPADAAIDWMQFLALIETETLDYDVQRPGELKIVTLGEGVIHRIPFEGMAGQTFSGAASGAQDSQSDPVLVLLAPDGTPLIADDDSGGGTTALILGYELPVDGNYTLIVSHSLGEATGDVGVQFELAE
ncbi:MAG: tetratricopeptide repeat protein [Chloroflexota bacterium]|nr:tetratricopeptide repeat protein [Chloroflexota bacterium]